MKKLVIAFAAVAMAAIAQAAAINWSAAAVSSGDGVSWNGGKPASKGSGYAAYFFITSSTQASDTIVSYDAVVSALAAGDLSVLDNATKQVALNTNGAVPTTAVGTYGVTQADTVSAFMVVFDNSAADEAAYFAASNIKTAEIAQGASSNSAMSWTGYTAAYGWTEMAAVPEPTSGLLLLLGMAGLALRRKQA